MGIEQSSMMCADTKNKCSVTSPISYKQYNDCVKAIPANDPNRQQKINACTCGNKTGTPTQCCDKTSATANLPADAAKSRLYNIIYSADGSIQEYRLCKCVAASNSATDLAKKKECEQQKCSGYKTPTNYDLCKIRSKNPNSIKSKNDNYDVIAPNNTYDDCYATCK